jgi:4-hydroxythreonine-4-phosphate dehydrogenase
MSETQQDGSVRPIPRLVLTTGDPNGVGPEIVLKCLSDERLRRYFRPIIVGTEPVLREMIGRLEIKNVQLRVVSREEVARNGVPDDPVPLIEVDAEKRFKPEIGRVSAEAGRVAMRAVEIATDLCLDGSADAMVTAPISKEAISIAGYKDPGHTEFITKRVSGTRHTMMMVADSLRVGLVTGHVPIWDVPKGVTKAAILEKIETIDESLKQDFGIPRPKIALLGLNPHAGDGGIMGKEEIDAIIPAIQTATENGRLVFGPFPADGFFAIGAYRLYDAVLAMYHDQGLIPFKTLAFESGVNYTAGLPIVRTSPDHGTAFDIAGTGAANPASMRSAIYVAMDVARRRIRSTEVKPNE